MWRPPRFAGPWGGKPRRLTMMDVPEQQGGIAVRKAAALPLNQQPARGSLPTGHNWPHATSAFDLIFIARCQPVCPGRGDGLVQHGLTAASRSRLMDLRRAAADKR